MTSDSTRLTRRAGRSHSGQLSALDPRDMLANRVDLVDRRSAFQQTACNGLFFSKRHAFGRQRHECGTPTRQQAEYQVVFPKLIEEPDDLLRSLHTGGVGNGMSCFDQLDTPKRRRMAVLDIDPRLRRADPPAATPWRRPSWRPPCRRRLRSIGQSGPDRRRCRRSSICSGRARRGAGSLPRGQRPARLRRRCF